MSEVRGPAPRPCDSCPYRQDVPSGIWAAEEYAKLVEFDAPAHEQPHGLFYCHQNPLDSGKDRLCAGWVACHGSDLLGLRIAVAFGRVAPEVFDYETDVPVFASGQEAAAHGLAEIEDPGSEARLLVDKIAGQRPDVMFR